MALNLSSKIYGLAVGRKPQTNPYLSGLVYIVEATGRGYAYIRFTEALVEALGKRMPRGISIDEGAYLKAIYMPATGVWRIFCMYALGREEGILIQEYKGRPGWLGETRRADPTVSVSRDWA